MGVFQMPSLGADMEAGTLVEWLVKPGDTVHRGDIVAVVETQKGAIEVEIFEDGVVQSLDADLGTKLPVGARLATIGAAGEVAPTAAPPPAPTERPPVTAEPDQPLPPEAPPAPSVTDAGASPAARKLAAERAIDLSGIVGSGPDGAVMLKDLAPAKPEAPKAPKSARPLGAMVEMRKAIAAAMQRSKREIPHFQLSQLVDVQHAMDWLADHNADRPPSERLLLGALFMKAAARAAADVREMNGHYKESGFVPASRVNLGVAVALRGGGLIAPAIPQADTLSLDQLMAAMKDLVARARAMRLRSSELTSGTITVSSLGEKGADTMAGIIFPPQVALLAIGAPKLRPWVVDRDIVARHVVSFTLSADHRVSDGRQATRFLSAVDTYLQEPEAL
ncbi:dihydrolipoamide acetyltransferase family protein [Tropicimonas isoalkanivorans]|uniref:Dihydrolipoamide acetyltransferase component of pyruvate dehydrogenase complex n=1 Tax=Tropicimonas isoalkanivorans TaxID=441112 RepID=A0A1I1LA33_9RHOB|nr:dihydrolipoamide acetyltransferase family protein [Tropicimonas isoalkanivorans]SFC69967.1 pyruvate dehydrogenase E2 component (dihydrolipoamide acetyltransferase) [Tropicimonas isoalkanivorans]